MSNNLEGKGHQFGGDWTDRKLDVLGKYLSAYTMVLKNTLFHKAYIDAFAGTGYRTVRRNDAPDPSQSLLFPDLAEPAPQSLLDGSVRIALQAEPRFDEYVFIERRNARCGELENLKSEFPDLAGRILIRQGDANVEIRELCSADWRYKRAVLFLDPYGLQVEWPTIEAIARTKAIDLWLLFPLGIGVNRLLTRSGDIPDSWRRRLNLLLGTEEWYEEFYRSESRTTLFGEDQEHLVKAKMETIGHYFTNRLEAIFAGVAPHPGVLRNSSNHPLYLLCFAVGNERAKDIALRIASHLLKEVQ